LVDSADPAKIRAAGYGYMYFGIDYWERLSPSQQLLLQSSCVRQIAEVDGIRSGDDYRRDFRRLLDIRDCK
jgi:hypothetical protein